MKIFLAVENLDSICDMPGVSGLHQNIKDIYFIRFVV